MAAFLLLKTKVLSACLIVLQYSPFHSIQLPPAPFLVYQSYYGTESVSSVAE